MSASPKVQLKGSFFDVEGADQQLFQKAKGEIPEPEEILASDNFHTKQKTGKIKPRLLVLTAKRLYLAKALSLFSIS